jgi:nucleotide-binding universal stress UspA family protein
VGEVTGVDERKARRLVVGVDGSEGSERALSFAIWIARELGAEVVAVHTLRPAAYPDAFPWALGSSPEIWERSWRDARTELERTLEEEWCHPLRDAEVPYRTAVVEGGPETLAQFADREEADMIVVGRRGRGGFSELVLGSVSHQLVHNAHRPVVVVPLR